MISELQKKLRDDLNSESGTTERKPESGQIISHWQSQDPIPSPRAPQIRSDRRIKQKKKSLHKVNNATAVLPRRDLKRRQLESNALISGKKSHPSVQLKCKGPEEMTPQSKHSAKTKWEDTEHGLWQNQSQSSKEQWRVSQTDLRVTYWPVLFICDTQMTE